MFSFSFPNIGGSNVNFHCCLCKKQMGLQNVKHFVGKCSIVQQFMPFIIPVNTYYWNKSSVVLIISVRGEKKGMYCHNLSQLKRLHSAAELLTLLSCNHIAKILFFSRVSSRAIQCRVEPAYHLVVLWPFDEEQQEPHAEKGQAGELRQAS